MARAARASPGPIAAATVVPVTGSVEMADGTVGQRDRGHGHSWMRTRRGSIAPPAGRRQPWPSEVGQTRLAQHGGQPPSGIARRGQRGVAVAGEQHQAAARPWRRRGASGRCRCPPRARRGRRRRPAPEIGAAGQVDAPAPPSRMVAARVALGLGCRPPRAQPARSRNNTARAAKRSGRPALAPGDAAPRRAPAGRTAPAARARAPRPARTGRAAGTRRSRPCATVPAAAPRVHARRGRGWHANARRRARCRTRAAGRPAGSSGMERPRSAGRRRGRTRASCRRRRAQPRHVPPVRAGIHLDAVEPRRVPRQAPRTGRWSAA